METEKLKGLSFCFHGTCYAGTREQCEKLVTENGGRIASVTRSLDYLVTDCQNQSLKMDKAKKYGIEIISSAQLVQMIMNDKEST